MDKECSAIDDANAVAPLLAKIILYIGHGTRTADEIADYAGVGIKFLRDSIDEFYSQLNRLPLALFVEKRNNSYRLNERGLAMLSDAPRRIAEARVKVWADALQSVEGANFSIRRK